MNQDLLNLVCSKLVICSIFFAWFLLQTHQCIGPLSFLQFFKPFKVNEFRYLHFTSRTNAFYNSVFVSFPRLWNNKPRLLNLLLLNLMVRWPTGAAIVIPPNTEYTQSIGAGWEKLPKIVKITLLQFNDEFGHGIFFTVWSSQYFQNIYRRKK